MTESTGTLPDSPREARPPLGRIVRSFLRAAGSTAALLAIYYLLPLDRSALWVAVNLAFPALGASGVPTVTSRVAIHVVIALGLWLGLERAELTPSQRRNVWLAVMIPLTLWLAVV